MAIPCLFAVDSLVHFNDRRLKLEIEKWKTDKSFGAGACAYPRFNQAILVCMAVYSGKECVELGV